MPDEEPYRVYPIVRHEHRGRAWVANGEIYYSPNCLRGAAMPQGHEEIKFRPHTSRASQFQEPIWWDKSSEWLGFIIRQPVPYSGVLIDVLDALPDKLVSVPDKGFQMSETASQPWKTLERLLENIAHVLEEKIPVIARPFKKPFLPSKLGFNDYHDMVEDASAHVGAGRDWFAVWLGYVYWLSQKIIERSGFRDDMAPSWYLHIVRTCNDQPTLDLVRTTPLLQNMWKWNRVGVWLHHPYDFNAEGQPSAQWFVNCGVPVWYRWGGRERASMKDDKQFSLIRPRAEELQHATTWISPTLSTAYPEPMDSFGSYSSPSATLLAGEEVHDGPSLTNEAFTANTDNSLQATNPVLLMTSNESTAPENAQTVPRRSAKAAQKVWDQFWEACEALHEKLWKDATAEKKQTWAN